MWGKVARRIQSEWDYFRFVYGQETKYFWATTLFLLGLLASLLPSTISAALAIYSAAAGVASVAVGAWLVYRKWRQTKLGFRSEPSLLSNPPQPQWPSSRPETVATVLNPKGLETLLWFDLNLNKRLAELGGWTPSRCSEVLEGRIDAQPYSLPSYLRRIAPLSLRSRNTLITRKSGRPIRFNGRLLRLSSEPTLSQLDSGELVFQSVRYFDGECSNEVWHLTDFATSRSGVLDEFVLNRFGEMRSLDHSLAANIVGISILAITSDHKVLFVQQSSGNSVAPSSLAASGSGSLEVRDLKSIPSVGTGNKTFNASQLLLTGMLREMCEESKVMQSEILHDTAQLSGYFRWIARGLRPEFSGFVRLSVDFATLRKRRLSATETAFTSDLICVDEEVLLAASTHWPGTGENRSMPDFWKQATLLLQSALGGHGANGMSPSAEAAWVNAAVLLAESKPSAASNH